MTLLHALHRRAVLLGATALAACGGAPQAKAADPYAGSPWRKLSDADWKSRLSPPAYRVLRQEGTERAGTSPLDKETRRGTYVCAGCDLPLFKSDWKYDSRTAPGVSVTRVTSSRTGRGRQACAIATMAWR